MRIGLLEKKLEGGGGQVTAPRHETVGKTARTKTEVVKKQLDYCYPGQLPTNWPSMQKVCTALE